MVKVGLLGLGIKNNQISGKLKFPLKVVKSLGQMAQLKKKNGETKFLKR